MIEIHNLYWDILAKIWQVKNEEQQKKWLEENPELKPYFEGGQSDGKCSEFDSKLEKIL